jgi:arsenate reductase
MPYKVIKYLETIPTEKELKNVISKLNIKPIELIRTNEAIWKEKFKGKDLSEVDIINAMLQHPKLIERPIIINRDKALIGRPPERILDII